MKDVLLRNSGGRSAGERGARRGPGLAVLSVLVAVLAGGSESTAVLAQSTQTDVSPEVVTSELLPDVSDYASSTVRKGASTSAPAALVAPSPTGCAQKANDPHPSTHQRGRINAEVRATCRTRVPRMQHTAQLWESHWWGFSWSPVGVPGSFSNVWVAQGSAFANDSCRSSTFRGSGSGQITDVDGRTYYASTVSRSVPIRC